MNEFNFERRKSRLVGRACCDNAAGGKTSANGRAGAELRATGDEAVSDAGTEDAETKQRQRGKHRASAARFRGCRPTTTIERRHP